MSIQLKIKQWIENKQLLNFCYGAGVAKKSFLGRVINYDGGFLLIYHEDEKQIYNLSLQEIIDIKESKSSY